MNSISEKRSFLSRINLNILLPTILISLLGIVSLLSTTILPQGGFGDLEIVYKQILFVLAGIVIYFLISYLDFSYLKHWQLVLAIYIPTILLLLATLLFAPTINNVKRWLVVGGIQIQPSEIAKLSVIIITAVIISNKDKLNEWILFLISFLLTLPLAILVYLEPDASMSVLTISSWFMVAFLGLSNPLRNTILLLILSCVSGSFLLSSITSNNLWYILLIPGISIAIFSFYAQDSWKNLIGITIVLGLTLGIFSSVVWDNILKEYQKDRIEAFFNPTTTKSDIGFNVNQSRIAIGAGKILGKGFGNGTQSKRNFLPEHQTDFMFASYAEEFGLVGTLFLISLYGYLIVYTLTISMKTVDNPLISLISLGIAMKILLEVFINIGTNTGAIPATGIPLPLMSAGGSITVMTFISLGFVQNISKSVKKESKKNIVDFFDN